MTTVRELLASRRMVQDITLEKASRELKIKKSQLESLEKGEYHKLPEPAFVRGFIKNYAEYLGIDPNLVLAHYRREYDEKKFPKAVSPLSKRQNFFLTPTRIVTTAIGAIIVIFILYIIFQYSSLLKSPKLEVISPPDDSSTTVSVVQVSGKTEAQTSVSVNGQFAAIDEEGNFTTQIKLQDGKNTIEIIAAKKFSPKTKITRVIRLVS